MTISLKRSPNLFIMLIFTQTIHMYKTKIYISKFCNTLINKLLNC